VAFAVREDIDIMNERDLDPLDPHTLKRIL
jgi:hypothetical protein